jgi:hypothetical protein
MYGIRASVGSSFDFMVVRTYRKSRSSAASIASTTTVALDSSANVCGHGFKTCQLALSFTVRQLHALGVTRTHDLGVLDVPTLRVVKRWALVHADSEEGELEREPEEVLASLLVGNQTGQARVLVDASFTRDHLAHHIGSESQEQIDSDLLIVVQSCDQFAWGW